MARRWRHVLAAGPLSLLLSGCAAALLPVVAGGLVARQQVEGPGPATTRSAEARPEATVGREAPATLPSAAELPPLPDPDLRPPPEPQLARLEPDLPELPPPTVAVAAAAGPAGAFEAFARYAADHAAPPPPGRARPSALIDPASLARTPQLGRCMSQPPAVVLDLDPGAAPFDLADPPFPVPGLAESLASLRFAGLTVLWVSSLPEREAERLATILRATGLDPDGEDRLVLLREANDRKATRLQQEARRFCVIAFAADRRGDFEEAFDYLRDPEGPVAQALESHIGAGWFLTPPPIG